MMQVTVREEKHASVCGGRGGILITAVSCASDRVNCVERETWRCIVLIVVIWFLWNRGVCVVGTVTMLFKQKIVVR